MLVSKNVKIVLTPNAKPQCEPIEYRLRLVPNAKFSRWLSTFLFFCVSITFALGPVFQWNMGLTIQVYIIYYSEGIHNADKVKHPQVWPRL